MKISKVILFVLAMVLCLNGCNHTNISNETKQTTSPIQQTEAQNNSSNKAIISLNEVNISDAELYYYINGAFSNNSFYDSAMVVVSENSIAHLVVKSNGSTYTLKLGEIEPKPFNTGELKKVDINNDNVDELLFWAEQNGNGHTIAGIFKLANEELVQIIDFNKRTDVSYDFIADKKIQLSIDDIGYTQTIDISKEFHETDFDDNGIYIGSNKVVELPVNSLTVETTNQTGGKFVLDFSYGIKLNSYLGEITVSLAYEEMIEEFIVQKVVFE